MAQFLASPAPFTHGLEAFSSTCCKSIRVRHSTNDEPVRLDASSLAEAIKSFTDIVRRQLPVFLVVIPCAMTLGLLYLLTTPSSYTAVARMVIDSRKVPAFQQQQQAMGDLTIDTAAVATQVEILMSENVSLAVIKDLKLTEDPEFVGHGAGLIGALFHLISGTFDSGTAVSEFELQRRALAAFESRRKVTRVPLTYVMEISFRSLDRGKAAQIANAISDAYIVDQLEAKYQSTRRASTWLQDRIKSLRADTTASQQALVEFKQKNNIVETGGKRMNEQQLGEVTSQLILAHAATAEAKARLDRIQEVMRQDIPDASVADALKSEIIIKLRGQYLEMAAREAIWSKKYGPDHLAAVGLRSQMQELRRNIDDEMRKIAESTKSEYEIALARESSIKKSLDSAVADSRITGQAQVQLTELESNASTAKTMYENFLQRYMEAIQEQSFPISEARLISPAAPPSTRSQSKYPDCPRGDGGRRPDGRLWRRGRARGLGSCVPYRRASRERAACELHRDAAHLDARRSHRRGQARGRRSSRQAKTHRAIR